MKKFNEIMNKDRFISILFLGLLILFVGCESPTNEIIDNNGNGNGAIYVEFNGVKWARVNVFTDHLYTNNPNSSPRQIGSFHTFEEAQTICQEWGDGNWRLPTEYDLLV